MSVSKSFSMCQAVKLLILLLSDLAIANRVSICGEQLLHETNGTIKFSSSAEETIHCNWTIVTQGKSITTLKVIRSFVARSKDVSSLCLTIQSSLKKYLQTCSPKIISTAMLSLREQNISVDLESVDSYSNISLAFASRNETECFESDFQCRDKSGCYNLTHTFSSNIVCSDHSDKLGFGSCNEVSTPCNRELTVCFNLTQRCDGVVNCPSGEDELNCTSFCPNSIKCPMEDKCIRKSDICDRNLDCSDQFDEANCDYASTTSNIFIVTILFVVCSFFCIIFLCLVFRWMVTKRDMNRLMDNLPEIPLAPFQGPGENDEVDEDFEAEFTQGGEIFDHYMQSLSRKKSSKAVQVNGIVPKFSHLELDAENEVIVLASLNVPSDMCVGLTISQSSIESIKTLKSIRKRSEDASGSSSASPTVTVVKSNPEIRSVRSRTSSKVKFAWPLEASPGSSEAQAPEPHKPKAKLAGGDFFILAQAKMISESTVSFGPDRKTCLEDIPGRSDAVKKHRSAPSPCWVNETPAVVSKSLGSFFSITGSSRWWNGLVGDDADTGASDKPGRMIAVQSSGAEG